MDFFSDADHGIEGRLADRPERPYPKEIPSHPQTPWLASTFSPEEDRKANPSQKTTIRSAVNILIITACIITVATPFLLGIITLINAYG